MAVAERQAVVELPRRRPLVAALAELRPRQWAKNLLLFAGIVFAARLDDPFRWLDAVAAFAAYCAASSASYVLNDVVDVRHDRAHPVKRTRPIARGDLAVGTALALASALAAGAIGLSIVLGLGSLLLLLAFLLLQVAYSLVLKRLVLVDVLAIAGLFVIRAAAGAEAVDVPVSPWLLVCTALLALLLALGKRRAELVLMGTRTTPGRSVLDRYSLPLVDRLVTAAAAATVVVYTLYTILGRESLAMTATIPFVVFGVARYLLLLRRRQLGEEPEELLLRDVPILAAVTLWVIASALASALGDA